MFSGPCFPWRWWHRRLRRIDVAVYWPAIVRAGYSRAPDTPMSKGDAEARITAMWRAFQNQPGQEHWSCDCAADDDLYDGAIRRLPGIENPRG